MVPGWLAGFLGCVRDPVADSIQNLCDPRISGKSAFFSVQKHYLEPSAERFWKRKPSIPGSFVRDIGVLETDFQKMVILRRRNGHPETEGIKNEHLASTKRSFVICTLAQLAGFVPYVELPKMVK